MSTIPCYTLNPEDMGVELHCDEREAVESRRIEYVGPGWYSLDEKDIYRFGKFATFSRILVTEDDGDTPPPMTQ